MEAKKAAAELAVARHVEDGMIVGLGTGSTAYWAIQNLGERVRQGLRIQTVATSLASEALARSLGIPQIAPADIAEIDVTIDGADEVDPRWNLIKGGGGALLREKIVACASRKLVIVVDEGKLVPQLGAFPLPVEIVRFGWELTQRKLAAMGAEPVLRLAADGQPVVTDNGNHLLDCRFGAIPHPAELETALRAIPGVVECGLFTSLAREVIVGYNGGKAVSLVRT